MANFDAAFRLTLGHEGEYVNDSDDPGGETKWGISARSYPNLNIKDLRVEDAKKIYRRDFWNKAKLESVRSQIVANKLFDIAVHQGVTKAVLFAQKACNTLGTDILEDGVMGSITVEAINSFKHAVALVNVITYYRIEHYLKLAEQPSRKKYIFGWLNRA
jgi:lysozyme family protein